MPISIYLGFSSQSHFNHAFKKFMNTTPIKYRNNK
ncbi:MAG: AraC family transcriptional regulator [Bacilli bacterium]|nr:AraC family transcriptional regulator [Bacilli bacterium]